MTRLLKGIHNSRAPQPPYTQTWNVDDVLKHIRRLGDNSQLSLKDLSEKLATLMTIIEASRTSDLHALDLKFSLQARGSVLHTSSLTKKREAGAPAKQLLLELSQKTPNMCRPLFETI